MRPILWRIFYCLIPAIIFGGWWIFLDWRLAIFFMVIFFAAGWDVTKAVGSRGEA